MVSLESPTCDLIFYLPLHVQRLHVDSAVANEPGAGDPSVGLAEPIFLVLISKDKAELLAKALISEDKAEAPSGMQGADCAMPPEVTRGRS